MLRAIILFFILILISAGSTFAARNLSITSNKNTLSLDEELIITASVSGFENGEKIYLKGAFYKDGSSNYFGFTKFNNDWIKNSANALSQKEIIIGSWDNLVNVKVDYDDSGFTGIGDYKLKLGYYYITSGGNISSVKWSSNLLSVKIENEPSPTPKPVSASSSTTEDYYEENSSELTFKPTQIPTASVLGKSESKSVKITDVKKEASRYAEIKPIEEVEIEKEPDESQVLGVTKESVFPKVYLAFGSLILVVAVFMILKGELRRRKIL